MWWLGHPRLPEILGESSVAPAAASTVCVILMRDWRERRYKTRQVTARFAYRPAGCDPIKGHEGKLIHMTLLADISEPGEVEKA